jgi:hypothetical protein
VSGLCYRSKKVNWNVPGKGGGICVGVEVGSWWGTEATDLVLNNAGHRQKKCLKLPLQADAWGKKKKKG